MLSINPSSYPSDLTNQQWELIINLIPPAKHGGRPRTTDIKLVLNAIFYVCRTGCAWRYLPKTFPPWKTIYGYFSSWQKLGVWQSILVHLIQLSRIKQNRNQFPSLVIIDAQSVRAPKGESRGWDGFKKVKGRKREIVVDTLGLLWSTYVHEANRSETHKGIEAIYRWPLSVPHPQKVLGDYSYGKGPFDILLHYHWGMWPEVRRGSRGIGIDKYDHKEKVVKDSNLKPTRWIVERSFAWFNNFRRLSRDYERKTIYSEAFIYISALCLVLTRLAEVK